jgi:hypothetical protein
VVAASATDECIALGLLEMTGGVRDMREDEENQLVPEKGRRITSRSSEMSSHGGRPAELRREISR